MITDGEFFDAPLINDQISSSMLIFLGLIPPEITGDTPGNNNNSEY